jgi:electron transport complex protein RnfA
MLIKNTKHAMNIDFHQYIMILIGTVLVNNIVLVKILGLCPFMGVSKKLEASIGMAAATAFVLTIGSMTSWAINEIIYNIYVHYHLLWLSLAWCNLPRW